MRNTIKTIALVSVLSSLPFVSCFAATIDSAKEDMDTQIITVSGSGLIADDKVLIEIFNYDNEQIDYDTGLEGIVAANTDSDGSYSVSFKLPERINTGMKMVAVKPLVGKYAQETLDFYSSTSINTILDNWNDAINNQDKSKMENVVNDATALKIILNSNLVPNLQSELLTKNKDVLTAELLKLSAAARIDDFKEDFIDPYVNFAINNLSADTASKLILEFYDSIDTQKGDVYQNIISKMSDDEKLVLFKDAVSKKTGNMANDDFVKLIYNRAVFNKFNEISYYQDVKPFIELYNTEEYFNIDFTTYNLLKSTYEVDSKVLSKRNEYSDFSAFKSKYEGWMDEQYESENQVQQSVSKPSSSSSSSGGRGTSSGGGVIKVNNFTPTDVKEDIAIVEEEIFNDIEGFEWAKEHIMSLYNKGVVDGVADKEFAPYNTVTREQFVKMISVLCQMPENPSEAGFEDVKKDEWYEKYINGAKEIGLVSGQSETIFGVGENITRQDAALLLFNAIKISKPELIEGLELDKLSFNDSGDVSSYAIYAVSVLNKLGVLNGDDKGYLLPLSNASRAEAAVMINKVLSLID